MPTQKILFTSLLAIGTYCGLASAEMQILSPAHAKIIIFTSDGFGGESYEADPEDEIKFEESVDHIKFSFNKQRTFYIEGKFIRAGDSREVSCIADRKLFDGIAAGISLSEFLKLKNTRITCGTNFESNAYVLAADYRIDSRATPQPLYTRGLTVPGDSNTPKIYRVEIESLECGRLTGQILSRV